MPFRKTLAAARRRLFETAATPERLPPASLRPNAHILRRKFFHPIPIVRGICQGMRRDERLKWANPSGETSLIGTGGKLLRAPQRSANERGLQSHKKRPADLYSFILYYGRISSTIGTSDDPIRPVICRNLTLFGKGRPWQRSPINILTLIQESARSVRPTMRSGAWTMEILTACDIHRHGPGSSPLA